MLGLLDSRFALEIKFERVDCLKSAEQLEHAISLFWF
jgi:hypothetical protein